MSKKKLTIADIKKNNNTTVPSVISKIKAREVELTALCVIIILGIIITSSYLIFSSVRNKKDYNTLKTGSIQVVFNETESGIGNTINILNQSPIIDNKSKELEPIVFNIKNNSKKPKKYIVTVEEDNNMIDADKCRDNLYNINDLKYSIDNKKIKKLNKNEDLIKVYEEKLKPKEEKKHYLRIWISSDYSGNVKKHFHGKIVVVAEDDKNEEIIP